MLKRLQYVVKKDPYMCFLFKSLFFLVIVVASDFIVGSGLRYLYFQQITGERFRTTYDIEKTNADVIIFGSSRANHHYHPEVFEKRLNQSCRNVGRDGQLIPYHYAILKSIVKKHPPKVVILDIVPREFILDANSYDRLTALLPYYKDHPEMRDIIEKRSSTEKIKLLSQIYPFNSLVFSIVVGNTQFNKLRNPDFNGYIPMPKELYKPVVLNDTSVSGKIDSTKLTMYSSFISTCKSHNIKVIVVCSPIYYKFNKPVYSLDIAKELARRNNVPFLDFSKDIDFISNPKLFADNNHLTDEGAKQFSNELIDELQKSAL